MCIAHAFPALSNHSFLIVLLRGALRSILNPIRKRLYQDANLLHIAGLDAIAFGPSLNDFSHFFIKRLFIVTRFLNASGLLRGRGPLSLIFTRRRAREGGRDGGGGPLSRLNV